MNSHDAALLRCGGCGWTLRGWDVPEGVSVEHVLSVHRQGACPNAQGSPWAEGATSEA